MKLFFDFFPIFIFFISYKFWGIYTATAVFIGVSALQMGLYWFMYRRLESMHVITFLLGVLLGGTTLLLHNELFIKWKPSVIYWAFAIAFLVTQFIGDTPLIKRMLQKSIDLPNKIWNILNLSWAIFFTLMGIVNIYIIYNFSTDTWVNFKLFGFLGITALFVILQALFMSKHIKNSHPIK